MTKAKVHNYKIRDIASDTETVRPYKATREAILRIGATVIPATGETVDSELLDGSGFVRPPAAG
jgi:hypothetical protein